MFKKYKTQLIRGTVVLSVLLLVLCGLYVLINSLGLLEQFNSLSELFNNPLGYVIYILLYVLLMCTMIFSPIFVIIPGALVLDTFTLIILSSIASIIGSLILYIIGLYGGKKVILWVLEGDINAYQKWENFMHRSKYTIFLAILFPLAFDQVIFMLCGSAKMNMKEYIPIITLGKIPGVITTIVSIGFVATMPWYLSLLGVSGIGGLMYLSFKYENKIDEFINKGRKKK